METQSANYGIQEGARVIFQRKDWCKECVVGTGKSLMICKLKTKTDDIVGLPYGSVVEWNKQIGKFERCENDEEDADIVTDVDYGDLGTGDNRNLVDNSSAQLLTTGEIAALKSQGVKGMELIGNLVQNSSTFSQRQEYAKEKYVQKKKDKHIYRFRILKPSLRLVCEVYNCQKASKINYLRVDSLALMLSFANIHSGSKVLVVDGAQGILLAAAMERTGGTGTIVHIHPGPQPIIPAFDMFGFPKSWVDSVLHLSIDNMEVLSPLVQVLHNSPIGNDMGITDEPPKKRRKLSEEQTKAAEFVKQNPMDSLILATRHDPKPLLLFLLPFLGPSCNFVVHSPIRELLQDTFCAVRSSGNVVRVCLNETWLRYYQVLESRTHPENSMSGSGGYLLSGTVVESSPIVAMISTDNVVGDKVAEIEIDE